MDQLQFWLDTGRLDASKKITVKELYDSGCVKSLKDGIELYHEVLSAYLHSVKVAGRRVF